MTFCFEVFFFVVGVFMQFVLEVLGAGGAIWGMSEVWHMRGGTNNRMPQSATDMRWCSNVVFCLGFIRFFFRYGPENAFQQALVDPQAWLVDYGAERRGNGKGGVWETGLGCLGCLGHVVGCLYPQRIEEYDPTKTTDMSPDGKFALEIPFFILGVFLQWVLEVLGAGGATWGMSEVWHLRGDTSYDAVKCNNDFRWVANVTFCVGIIRMLQKYCPSHGIHDAMLGPQDWLKTLGAPPADNSHNAVQMSQRGNVQSGGRTGNFHEEL